MLGGLASLFGFATRGRHDLRNGVEKEELEVRVPMFPVHVVLPPRNPFWL